MGNLIDRAKITSRIFFIHERGNLYCYRTLIFSTLHVIFSNAISDRIPISAIGKPIVRSSQDFITSVSFELDAVLSNIMYTKKVKTLIFYSFSIATST